MPTKKSKTTKLRELAEVMQTAPKGSAKYRKAMQELDTILGTPSELELEGEEYDENRESEAD